MANPIDADLRGIWALLWRVPCDPAILDALLARYNQAYRHYHNARHIHDCLTQLKRALPMPQWRDSPTLPLALFYHDAIYDPRAADNEVRSAGLARHDLTGLLTPAALDDVIRLILVTDHKRPPGRDDESLIVDVDLSILGRPMAEFDAYETAIRREYSHVPDDQFTTGRAAILRHFLARPMIYSTDMFRRQYETPARVNLSRSLDRLLGTPGRDPDEPLKEPT